MDFRKLVTLLSLAMVACDPGPSTGSTPDPTTTTTTLASTTTGVSGTNCPGGEPMTETGRVLDVAQPSTDAESIGTITWDAQPGCETFTIELVTDQGAPATTPPSVTIELIRELSILRVHLALDATAVTDQLVETGLVGRYFVVRKEDRSLFVDFHLTAPARVRASLVNGPASVVIELEPGGSSFEGAPAIGDLVVLTSPQPGPSPVPVVIEGYGRPFEATVVYRFRREDVVILQGTTNATDYSETWGSFAATADPGTNGALQLFVGQLSAEDGSERGVVIDLELP